MSVSLDLGSASAIYPADEHGEAGFSMIEALVVLAIASTLMVLFGQVYVSAQRSHARLETYFEDGRNQFYSRQQLRTLIAGVSVPANFGQVETTSGRTAGRLAARAAEDASNELPLEGNTEAVAGYLTESILGPPRQRTFSLSIEAPSRSSSRRMVKVQLDEDVLWFDAHRQQANRIYYVDEFGTEHTTWPPQDADHPSSPSSDPYIPWADLLPNAIGIEFGDGEDRHTIVAAITK